VVAFSTLSALAEGFEVLVVTDSSGTFNTMVLQAAWNRMTQADVQMNHWFSVSCELQRDWCYDIEALGNLLSQRIPNYRNLMSTDSALATRKHKFLHVGTTLQQASQDELRPGEKSKNYGSAIIIAEP
jgi:nicotinamidase-related amidase